MQSPREVSESYWVAECHRDIDAVLAHFHPDATYEDAGGWHQGLEDLRGVYEASARAFPGLEVEIVREFASADGAGAFEFDAVLVDPAGTRHRIRGVNVVAVRDGRFTSVRSYEDPPTPI